MKLSRLRWTLIGADGTSLRILPAGEGCKAWIQLAKRNVVMNLDESGLRPMGPDSADGRPAWRPSDEA